MTTRPTTRQRASLFCYADKTADELCFLAEWLFEHRKDDWSSKPFDYPKYGGLPRKFRKKLSSATVDLIQNNLYKLPDVKSPREVLEWLMHI